MNNSPKLVISNSDDMLKYTLLFSFVATILWGCDSNNPKQPEVQIYGALKDIMHKGDISAKYNLADLAGQEHVYALGAVANLKGEILVWDGKPYVSTAPNDTIVIDTTWAHEATLLVYCQVSEWQRTQIPDTIISYIELEQFIDAIATEKGLDMSQPFPFVLGGRFDNIKFHIIDWEEDDHVHSHEKHKAAGFAGTLEGECKLLGFYSRHHHAIFTHHSTNMHLHVMDPITGVYAHVDEMDSGGMITLYLPAVY